MLLYSPNLLKLQPKYITRLYNLKINCANLRVATHSSTLAWQIPWTEEPGGLQSTGSLGVGHNWATSLLLFTFMHWRRQWQPTPVFLPGESQGRGSLVGCCLGLHRDRHDWSDLAVAAAWGCDKLLLQTYQKLPMKKYFISVILWFSLFVSFLIKLSPM